MPDLDDLQDVAEMSDAAEAAADAIELRRTPPCKSCPWRVGADADAIPGFSMEMAENLVRTTSGDLGAPVMACHQSREGDEIACAGWLAVEGYDSITVRIMIAAGRLNPATVYPPGPDWPALYPDFKTMLDNLYDTFDGEPTPEAAAAHAKMVERALAAEEDQ